ncbi:MAG: hypothetical protein WA821_10215 [Anaerolineales bacterium]
MLATLLVWLYTFFLCYVYGCLFLKLLRADLPASPLIVIAGLVVLTTLASFFSLFFQTGLFINLLLLTGAMGAILTRKIPAPRIGRPAAWIPLIALFLALLLVLENATHRPLNPDTNIYHAQAIHWIESFPAVPGLGNLHGRLAYNSAWFVGNALFSLAFLGLGSFHLTAGVLFLSVLLYCWGGLGDILRGEYKPSALIKLLVFPLTFALLGAEISSPGTDLPASLLLWLVAVLWAEQERPFHPLLIVVLAAFVVTVKLSAAPALLLIPIVLMSKTFTIERTENNREKSGPLGIGAITCRKSGLIPTYGRLVICAALVLLPFLARNVILSGYLLYPFPSIDFFRVDWKVPLERVVAERESILAWGRFPRLGASRVLAMPLREWLPKWLAAQTLNRRLILAAALLSPLAALPGLRLARRYWLGWLVFLAGTLFWLFSAPDFRFGYGFLIGTILLALAPWLAWLFKRIPVSPAKVSVVISLAMAAYLVFALVTSFEARDFASRLLLPAGYDRVPTQSCALANGAVFCAKAYDACSYNAFPCVPSPRPWVELRNAPDLRDGFRAAP